MPPDSPERPDHPSSWKDLLSSKDPSKRLEGINVLAREPKSSEEVVGLLERMALNDPVDEVRQKAEETLLAYPHQPVYRNLMGSSEDARRFMLYELGRLEKQGAIEGRMARLLKARYALMTVTNPNPVPPVSQTPAVVEKPANPPKPVSPKQPMPSLTQILLSETTIKIALYLGAFFVIAAAFILAALVEIARLPVLASATLIFLGISIGLKKRLPLAGFVLFSIVLLLIPIDGQVLLTNLHLTGQPEILFYWAVVWLFTLCLSAAGLFYFHSRLMSAIMFLAGVISLFYLTQGASLANENALFLFGLWNLAGVFLAYVLSRKMDNRLFWPLFGLSQTSQAIILVLSLSAWFNSQLTLLLNLSRLDSSIFQVSQISWVWVGLLWFCASAYYFLSDFLTRRLNKLFWGFAIPGILTLLPVPSLILAQFNPDFNLNISALWVWGLILSFLGERFRTAGFKKANWYQYLFLSGFVFFACLAPVSFTSDNNPLAVSLSLQGSALAAIVLSRLKCRWFFNVMAIGFGAAAYFTSFQIPQIIPIRNSLLSGEIMLIPAFMLLGLDWIGRIRRWNNQIWVPSLIFGSILYVLSFLVMSVSYGEINSNIVFLQWRYLGLSLIQLLFLAFYSRTIKSPFNTLPWSLALINGYLAVFSLFNIPEIKNLNLYLPFVFTFPALVYLGLEWRLRQRGKSLSWRVPLLGMGIIAVLLTLVQLLDHRPEETWMVVGILTVYSVFWVFEARSLKTVYWLPWLLSLICFYSAYLIFWTIPEIDRFNLNDCWTRMPPAVALLGLEWVLRRRGAALNWRIMPLGLGILAVLVNSLPLFNLSPAEIWIAVAVFTVYSIFWGFEARSLKSYNWIPWLLSLVSIYAGYHLFWQIPEVKSWQISPVLTMLPPALIFLGAEWLLRKKNQSIDWYLPDLLMGLLALSIHCAYMVSAPFAESYLVLIVCAVYAVFMGLYSFSGMIYYGLYWSAAFLFGLTAYWRLFDLQGWPLSDWSDALKLLPPALVLLGLNLLFRKVYRDQQRWLPVLILGIVCGVMEISITLFSDWAALSNLNPLIIFIIWGLFFIFYLWVDHRPGLVYLSTTSLVLAAIYGLRYWYSGEWVLALNILAAFFYLAGFYLLRKEKLVPYGLPFLYSGLCLGALVSLTAPYEFKSSGVAGVALTAVIFTVEGLRRRNVWWGFPACVLYFMAYCLALLKLNISDPQYYSIGAALLGVIMHYLLLKTANPLAALITGALSQLILFCTSYIQMVQSLDLKFFFMLFFQAMVIFPYGLIVRSRTLVLGPIAFAILGVTTVTLTILKGLSTALIIGITGLVLLSLGVLGLFMRGRLMVWIDNFKLKLENW